MSAVRLAAIADLHCTRTSQGAFRPIFARMAAEADILLICGDLTDRGHPEELEVLIRELDSAAGKPILCVLGNHDYESGLDGDLRGLLAAAGIRVLDGDTFEHGPVGFVGVKGFLGGFGGHTLQPWGERAVKAVVEECAAEAMKLESGLARLRTPARVVLLHYAPIQATVEGEPPAIFPFLGSSRLEEPLRRHAVTVIFHGHAHHGAPEGRAAGRVPVYNVAMSALKRANPDGSPFRIFAIDGDPTGDAVAKVPEGRRA
jgi:Icc-related predicted phosphoesterase